MLATPALSQVETILEEWDRFNTWKGTLEVTILYTLRMPTARLSPPGNRTFLSLDLERRI